MTTLIMRQLVVCIKQRHVSTINDFYQFDFYKLKYISELHVTERSYISPLSGGNLHMAWI
jgi:hypothetical protein